MASPLDESKVFIPFIPSLQHCATVKIAVQLRMKFGLKFLEEAFTAIQLGHFSTGRRYKYKRAMQNLLDIPPHLRRSVMEAVYGSHYTVNSWSVRHSIFFRLKEKDCNIHWRSDGAIDELKTAQNLIWNAKIHVMKRFEIACQYCLEESVQALWIEMEASGQVESLRMDGIVGFWVRRMQRPSTIPWAQTLSHQLTHIYGDPRPALHPRLFVYFPLFGPEDRLKYIHRFDWARIKDLRFCLHALTKKEEEQMLKKLRTARHFLSFYLSWPLQTQFLETIAKLWDYVDAYCFRGILARLLNLNDKLHYKDFDYSQLFGELWEISPLHLREDTKKFPRLRKAIDSYFEDKRRKRKSIDDEQSKNQ